MTRRNVNTDDPWEFFVYDDSWRMVAAYKNTGSTPYSVTSATSLKERYVPHAAGLDGRGGSSYIDCMAVRDLDLTGDATLEERGYFIQNWRADLVGVLRPDGVLPGWFKYSAYGKHQELLLADVDDGSETGTRDGGITQDDFNYFYEKFELGTSEADLTNDGGVSIDDLLLYIELFEAGGPATTSHVMYAGYQYGAKVDLYHVRFRVYSTELGAWLSEDPLDYFAGENLFEYCISSPIDSTDPLGLVSEPNPGDGFKKIIKWVKDLGLIVERKGKKDHYIVKNRDGQYITEIPGHRTLAPGTAKSIVKAVRKATGALGIIFFIGGTAIMLNQSADAMAANGNPGCRNFFQHLADVSDGNTTCNPQALQQWADQCEDSVTNSGSNTNVQAWKQFVSEATSACRQSVVSSPTGGTGGGTGSGCKSWTDRIGDWIDNIRGWF